ncbi:TetR family transcriptional regulator [Catellatospora sp. TT07R-123]|uniref:TetR/AcrR family transcriptional regulator n=1 Tax=Catellatospora sp. TT07R-123 TaxID=2733863 RepID=UPI001B18588F|nr:TetR/AcrR family transcriptional regulator [Catellatospora sp. TT07R-123]GHJ43745.1 TetR family transcriptional regulator [Catellatospora sp. TT07R-123]
MPRIQAATVAEHRSLQHRALLDAARDILASGAPETPSLSAVAQRAGLARSSVYQYFRSREDLLEAVIADMFPRWASFVAQRMNSAATAAEQVLAYADANLELVAQGEHAVMRGLAMAAPGAALAESSRVLHDQLRVPLVDALARSGATQAPHMAELIQAVVRTGSQMIENGVPPDGVRGLVKEMLEPYLHGVGGLQSGS